MSSHIQATIAELQGEVGRLEDEAAQIKQTINHLCRREKLPPIYEAAGADAADLFAIKGDSFFQKPLSGAVREYLQLRQNANLGPATEGELYDALKQGGFEFGARQRDNAIRSLRISLTKSSHTFVKLPNGVFGLAEWYGRGRSNGQAKPAAPLSDTPKNTASAATAEPSSIRGRICGALKSLRKASSAREVSEAMIKSGCEWPPENTELVAYVASELARMVKDGHRGVSRESRGKYVIATD